MAGMLPCSVFTPKLSPFMIQQLAYRYRKLIAYFLLGSFCLSFSMPLYSMKRYTGNRYVFAWEKPIRNASVSTVPPNALLAAGTSVPVMEKRKTAVQKPISVKQLETGGPSQPEMSSFKSVNADNMVNLFTGDFSYNIPLLDIGGYPVNIFYDGGVGMEQEASWVGLGWNINPGTINRNMRGVPDDFNGEDKSIQKQAVKPNITWGFRLGADIELVGVKAFKDFSGSLGASLGMSFNNYLGPALDFGIKGGVGVKIAGKTKGEKSADSTFGLKLNAGFSANASSRYGFTFSPNVSLTATNFTKSRGLTAGIGLSTSYNSRSGIKELHLNEQMSYNYATARYYKEDNIQMVFSGSSSMSASLFSSTISFAKPSYVPSIRMPVTNEAASGHFQLGAGIFGGYVSGEVEVYRQKSSVESGDRTQVKPMVGYLYYEKAGNNPQAIMDFTRFNDKEVMSNTPIISAPQYTYDVFSIQGEGTGGSIRAYRNDYGIVKDNTTRSSDKNVSIGADIGPPGHYGANFNTIKTPSVIGEWLYGNKLRTTIPFRSPGAKAETWENVYFRNPGEVSVLHDQQFAKISGTDLVRFQLGGSNSNPTVEPVLERFSKANAYLGTLNMATASEPLERKKRTQVISFLTAEEAGKVGLDKKIKNYDGQTLLEAGKLKFTEFRRDSGDRKKHHISQINVTEVNGRRYVYGIPVYNMRQVDFTFSVANQEHATEKDKVAFDHASEANFNSPHLPSSSNTKRDGFLQTTETPPYAHAFLLSGLLSPDYVDVTGDGITEDDLGDAVKFNYSKQADHEWRTPLTSDAKANFNAGNRSETKDDKGMVSYGKRESWYLHSIESKTMIAVFTLEARKDGKGSLDTLKGIKTSDQSLKRLQKIDLYSKADLRKNGVNHAKPIKSVFFQYSYSLCSNAPGNNGEQELVNGQNVNDQKGKLTLDKIYFTFNKQNKAVKKQYVFSYGPATAGAGNPSYAYNAADRWGTYKPASMNPGSLKNLDYPYSLQATDPAAVQTIHQNAGAWLLKKVLLPSGGQMEVEYESDDYAFVQNKRAAAMMEIVGFGRGATPMSNRLYDNSWKYGTGDNNRVYIKVPEACTTKQEVYLKYLQDIKQLAFKLAVNMPKGEEFIASYATIADYNFVPGTNQIWIDLNPVDGSSPLVVTALEYLREQLPGQAYSPGYDVSESSGLEQVGNMLKGMLSSFGEFLKDPGTKFRESSMAQSVTLARSFVRLNDPDGLKYGGGHRVKSVKVKDNWQAMTGQFNSEYGQVYDYSTTEIFNSKPRNISSGVASYEPSIGGEENPFQTIEQVANKLPLGPTSYGAIEMPVLDAFFPAPVVGYSKVTVRSIKRTDLPSGKTPRSGIGRQVTEFYTARDFPVYYNHTSIDPASDKQLHQSNLGIFFYKYAFDSRALSQGFVVETNDMHGKLKSQASYAENDPTLRVNYTENFYRNTGSKGLNDKFDFVYNSLGGEIRQGNMGIDIELMTDTREFSVTSTSLEIQGQVDLFPVIFPFWLPFIWPVSGDSEDTYRAVTTTKVISYHGILDSMVVIDKGSQISTKNLVYDAETGQVLVKRTNNEFDQPVYNTSYPAWWAYSGMGPAYRNTDLVRTGVAFHDGKITSIAQQDLNKIIESGDELYLINPGSTPGDNCGTKLESGNQVVLWAFDMKKNTQALTNPTPEWVFMDTLGRPYTKDNVSFRIVRSGKRNMLDAMAATVTSMTSPITGTTTRKLVINNTSKAVTASAVEFREKWQTDNAVINRYKEVWNNTTCKYEEVIDCEGYFEMRINPYRKGLIGNFRPYRSMVFYGDRAETNPATGTNLPQNGFISNFKLYWDFNTSNNLVPDVANTKWVWNEESTRMNARGLELENRNALNIYTAAQYGFNKSIPVSIVSNSRYDEMFSEGFEDKDYQDNISNGIQKACFQPHVSFAGMSNSSIDTLPLGTNAHSGKYVLKVNANKIAEKYIPVSNGAVDQFNLLFTADTTRNLVYSGVNIDDFQHYPSTLCPILSGENDGSGGLHLSVIPTCQDSVEYAWDYSTFMRMYGYYITASGYFEVVEDGIYTISNVAFQPNSGVGIYSSVTSADGQYMIGSYLGGGDWQYCLPKGIYRVDCSLGQDAWEEWYCALPQGCAQTGAYFRGGGSEHYFTGANFWVSGFPFYKSATKEDGCIYTKPIAATDSMLNPTFSIPAGKKMLFSAWVKEACGNPATGVPCTAGTYSNNKVTVQFNDGSASVELKPAGPIIEGWQRVEGSFMAAAGASTVTLKLENNSSSAIYYDDIRIHPFNANMKSYVYDPVNLRLVAELDANNYATFYEYDEEGTLIRTKAETREGIKTITETRSAQQRKITTIQ